MEKTKEQGKYGRKEEYMMQDGDVVEFKVEHDIIRSMIRTYELMLVVRPDFPVEDVKKRDDLIGKIMKDAKIVMLQSWQKHLAYPIENKQTEFIFLFIVQVIRLKLELLKKPLGTDVIRFYFWKGGMICLRKLK